MADSIQETVELATRRKQDELCSRQRLCHGESCSISTQMRLSLPRADIHVRACRPPGARMSVLVLIFSVLKSVFSQFTGGNNSSSKGTRPPHLRSSIGVVGLFWQVESHILSESSAAYLQFAYGVEALHRFVERELSRRVHEGVFGVGAGGFVLGCETKRHSQAPLLSTERTSNDGRGVNAS
jgi:hypothetical protein